MGLFYETPKILGLGWHMHLKSLISLQLTLSDPAWPFFGTSRFLTLQWRLRCRLGCTIPHVVAAQEDLQFPGHQSMNGEVCRPNEVERDSVKSIRSCVPAAEMRHPAICDCAHASIISRCVRTCISVRNTRRAECSAISDAKMKNNLDVAEKPRASGAIRSALFCNVIKRPAQLQ